MTQSGTKKLVHDGLIQWSERTPDETALSMGGQSLTFHDLAKRSHAIATIVDHHLARRVGLCLPNGFVFVESFFGTLMAGACACIFDPAWPTNILRTLVNRHQPNLFIGASDLNSTVSSDLKHIQTFNEADLREAVLSADEAAALRAQPSPEMPFLIGFTSGSGGMPKAFIRSHDTWIESFRHSAIELGTHAGDVVVAPGPLSHGLTLYAAIESISAGACVVLHRQFQSDRVFQSLKDMSATVLVVVPSMLDVIVEDAVTRKLTNISVDRIITAGSKLSPQLQEAVRTAFPNATTLEYYGASELSFVSVAREADGCPPTSVGRAFSGVEVRVLTDAGTPAAAGQVGSIWVKSAMVSQGYVGPTDGSGFRTDNSWATVGDLGHFDDKGFLYLDGREGSVITSAGYTIYPSAIEAVLHQHPAVAEAVVIGLPDPRWGEVIAAAIVQKPDFQLTEKQLAEHCHKALEPYACPRRWRIVQSLDRTSSGKPRRAEIEALFD